MATALRLGIQDAIDNSADTTHYKHGPACPERSFIPSTGSTMHRLSVFCCAAALSLFAAVQVNIRPERLSRLRRPSWLTLSLLLLCLLRFIDLHMMCRRRKPYWNSVENCWTTVVPIGRAPNPNFSSLSAKLRKRTSSD